jgi:hypothetical protein
MSRGRGNRRLETSYAKMAAALWQLAYLLIRLLDGLANRTNVSCA